MSLIGIILIVLIVCAVGGGLGVAALWAEEQKEKGDG